LATYWNLIRESRSFPLIRFPQIWAIKNPKNYNYFHIFLFLKFPEKSSKSPRPHKLIIIASNCVVVFSFYFSLGNRFEWRRSSLPFPSVPSDGTQRIKPIGKKVLVTLCVIWQGWPASEKQQHRSGGLGVRHAEEKKATVALHLHAYITG
jgi:hypothetical protein